MMKEKMLWKSRRADGREGIGGFSGSGKRGELPHERLGGVFGGGASERTARRTGMPAAAATSAVVARSETRREPSGCSFSVKAIVTPATARTMSIEVSKFSSPKRSRSARSRDA